MAFYSTRVNDDGTEIESSRITHDVPQGAFSFRSQNVHCDSIHKSVRNEDSCDRERDGDDEILTIRSCYGKNDRSSKNYTTVRYVNSAAFIEKGNKAQDDQDDESSDKETNHICLPDQGDVMDPHYQSHIIDQNEVPLLELNSNESFPSSNVMSYSYRKVCEVTKIIQKPDAYREWLDAKRTAKHFEKQKKKDEIERDNKEKEERKRLADEKFQKWLEKKTKSKLTEQLNKEKLQRQEIEAKKAEEREARQQKEEMYKEWLKRKLERERVAKEKIIEQERIEKEIIERRREAAAAEYEEWLKTADQKPKPVPLGQGLLTLKGSISKMYINETDWKPTDEYLQIIHTL